MYPGYWLNPQILAIDKHQARPLHPGSAWAAWAEPPGPMDLSGLFSPRRLLNEFKTREERGPLWVLGTPEVPLVGASVVLAGREAQQGHSWTLGLVQ